MGRVALACGRAAGHGVARHDAAEPLGGPAATTARPRRGEERKRASGPKIDSERDGARPSPRRGGGGGAVPARRRPLPGAVGSQALARRARGPLLGLVGEGRPIGGLHLRRPGSATSSTVGPSRGARSRSGAGAGGGNPPVQMREEDPTPRKDLRDLRDLPSRIPSRTPSRISAEIHVKDPAPRKRGRDAHRGLGRPCGQRCGGSAEARCCDGLHRRAVQASCADCGGVEDAPRRRGPARRGSGWRGPPMCP